MLVGYLKSSNIPVANKEGVSDEVFDILNDWRDTVEFFWVENNDVFTDIDLLMKGISVKELRKILDEVYIHKLREMEIDEFSDLFSSRLDETDYYTVSERVAVLLKKRFESLPVKISDKVTVITGNSRTSMMVECALERLGDSDLSNLLEGKMVDLKLEFYSPRPRERDFRNGNTDTLKGGLNLGMNTEVSEALDDLVPTEIDINIMFENITYGEYIYLPPASKEVVEFMKVLGIEIYASTEETVKFYKKIRSYLSEEGLNGAEIIRRSNFIYNKLRGKKVHETLPQDATFRRLYTDFIQYASGRELFRGISAGLFIGRDKSEWLADEYTKIISSYFEKIDVQIINGDIEIQCENDKGIFVFVLAYNSDLNGSLIQKYYDREDKGFCLIPYCFERIGESYKLLKKGMIQSEAYVNTYANMSVMPIRREGNNNTTL